MRRSIAALILITGLYACRRNQNTDKVIDSAAVAATGSPTDSLTYSYDSVKVYSKTPVSKNKLVTDSAKAVIIYPVLSDPNVGSYIQNQVIELTGKKGIYKTYKEEAAGFIREYEASLAKDPTDRTWFQHIDLAVKANYPNYLSVLNTYQDYKGGAHPNTLYTYLNYNPKTYQTITLDSLITLDGMPKLRSVAEAIFRKNEKLSSNASLSNGYFFPDGKFTLAATFTVTKEGILFLYNPYEIKAYAAGTTKLTVPFSQIKDIMKESSILVNFK